MEKEISKQETLNNQYADIILGAFLKENKHHSISNTEFNEETGVSKYTLSEMVHKQGSDKVYERGTVSMQANDIYATICADSGNGDYAIPESTGKMAVYKKNLEFPNKEIVDEMISRVNRAILSTIEGFEDPNQTSNDVISISAAVIIRFADKLNSTVQTSMPGVANNVSLLRRFIIIDENGKNTGIKIDIAKDHISIACRRQDKSISYLSSSYFKDKSYSAIYAELYGSLMSAWDLYSSEHPDF